MNGDTKRLLIHAAAAALGIATGAATAYFSKDPQLASAVGGACYLGAVGLGMVDPTDGAVVAATVTKEDIDAVQRVVTDVMTQNTRVLGNDILVALGDLRDILGTLTSAPGSTAPPPPPSSGYTPTPPPGPTVTITGGGSGATTSLTQPLASQSIE